MSEKIIPLSELGKTRTVPSFKWLTDEEVEAAWKLHRTVPDYEFAKRCDEEIIAPVIDRINKHFGQKNDPRYLAYMVQHEFMQSDEVAKQYRRW